MNNIILAIIYFLQIQAGNFFITINEDQKEKNEIEIYTVYIKECHVTRWAENFHMTVSQYFFSFLSYSIGYRIIVFLQIF